jgi:single-stranded DNA-specific DHH superfamily exonuclease
MKFLIGTKEEFMKFISGITKEDKVGIITHNDLDGFASAALIDLFLKSREMKVEFMNFIGYENEVFKKVIERINKNKITKLFITDFNADSLNLEDFEILRKKTDLFLIDHHPINTLFTNHKNVIKTESYDCSSYVIYDMIKGDINLDSWKFLVCAAMIYDFSYKNQKNLEFIKNIYPDVNEENIMESVPGKISNKITFNLIYFESNLKKVYDMILKMDFENFDKYEKQVKEEIDKTIEKFWKEAEFYPEKNIYFYFCDFKYNIIAVVSTFISVKKPDSIFVLFTKSNKNKNYVKVSARCQSKKADMNKLLQKAIEGLENANAGGHIAAAGATVAKKDLKKFKKRILSF